MSNDQNLVSLPCGLCNFSTPATSQANIGAMVELLKLHQTQMHQISEQKSGSGSNYGKIEAWIEGSDPVYCDPSEIGCQEDSYKALSAPAIYDSPYNHHTVYKPLSDIGQSTKGPSHYSPKPNSLHETHEMQSVNKYSENHRDRREQKENVYEHVPNQRSLANPPTELAEKKFCCSKKCFIICLAILIPLAGLLCAGGYFYGDKLFLQEEKKNEKIILDNRNGFVDEVYGHEFEQEDNMVFSVCGFSNKQGNKIGQVTYDRYFSNTDGFEPTTGAVAVPTEGIYLVNFYSHIDSGVPTYQTIQDKNDYYSAYIRLNGENLKFEGHVKSSLVGDTENQDDVTTGRNLILHLNKGDEVDVGLDKVMPNGAGLTHSSFCVVEIARSKLHSIYSCGFKYTHGNKKGLFTYDRHLTNSNGFGSESSLDLSRGSYVAPVEGVYLVNFDSHFDTGRGPTTKANEYRVVFRKNGESIGAEGSIITSLHGSDDNHDDVTTGRSISLHLKPNDQIDVFVEDVIPIGAGLTHSSFCVTLIHLIHEETPATAFCGFMKGPVNSISVLTYDHMFTRVDQFHFGGLDLQTGVFRAPKTGTYLVNFDTQIDSGPGPRSPEAYYSAYIRKNGRRLKFEGHVKSSVVGTDELHVNVITGRSLVLHLQGSDEIDIEANNVMADGGGFYNATFCVTLLRANKDALEE